MSPTDPPLPPSPDEPTEEPRWGGGNAGDAPVPGEPDGVDEPVPDGASSEPGEPAGVAPEPPHEEPPTRVPPATGDEVTQVLPTTGDDLTEVLPPTGDEPTDVLPPTGDEPTELLAGAVASDTTGEATREHRRRVSHRRYVMRRIGVSLAALAIVGAGVFLLVTLLGDEDDGASGTDSTTPVTTEAVIATPTTRVSTTTTTPATTEAEAAQNPAAVETSEASSSGEPGTSPAPDETNPSDPTSPDGTENTTATESSPPGTVVYDLESEASCEIVQTLRRGDAGPQVECLQERLNEITIGGEAFVVDGGFGAQTEAAVRAFQEANELGVDGIVGPATGELLGIWAG